MKSLLLAVLLLTLGVFSVRAQGNDVPVPSTCTPDVNAKLEQLIRSQPRQNVDNIMACGTAVSTQVHPGGPHGTHHIITLTVQLPDDGQKTIQIAINDALDGVVTANSGDSVFAYGQGYSMQGRWVAGIHDVHCATHSGADNGWTVVNGQKTPASCSQ